MRSKIMLLLPICLIACVLTGCWSRRELSDLAISVGMGFDKKGDEIQVTIQVVNPSEVASKKGATGNLPVTIYQATSATIFEALRKIATESSRRVYASHLRMLVISEEIAKEGITPILDGISRNHEMRSDFYIVVARATSAESVLKILTPIEKIPSNKLFSTLEMSEKVWAPTAKVKLDSLISDLQTEGKDPVLTGIVIKGDPEKGSDKDNISDVAPKASLAYSGLAVFKKDRLAGWLNEKESKGYNYISDKVKSTIGHLVCPEGGVIALEVLRAKTKVIGTVNGGKPRMVVDTVIEEDVGEIQCKIDIMDPAQVAELEKGAQKEVEGIMQAAIQKAKMFKADIFGFGQAVYRGSPKYWKNHKDDWMDQFEELPVQVNVEVKIRRLGTVNDSLLLKSKE